MTAPQKRTSKRITPSSVYLGHQQLRKAREAALNQKAMELGLKNRSQLIQLIADGELEIIRRSHSG